MQGASAIVAEGEEDLSQRERALAAWARQHDPHRTLDPGMLREGAAIAPLIETENGLGFEPRSFAELIAFLAEMPF